VSTATWFAIIGGGIAGAAISLFWAAVYLTQRRRFEARLRRLGESWLIKDFNVLYRVARQYVEAGCDGDPAPLMLQLQRLEPAFTDTEEVRRLMREKP